ncbi:MAG: YafY family protein [Pseudomonadota bacterium]
MRRTDRLFEIIQIFREQNSSLTAQEIADRLEVSVRTIYRDIQTLQTMHVPIDGEAGIGYIMRQGYDLPPINFTVDEIEAIAVGLNLVSRTGDSELLRAAQRVTTKIATARQRMENFRVSTWGAKSPSKTSPEEIRQAIRDQIKIEIGYIDNNFEKTDRKILPLVMIYYIESIVVVAWCELRNDFRHFRIDRIHHCSRTAESFSRQADALRKKWESIVETRGVA